MSFEVSNEWWKDLFDEVYLLTDARSVCDEVLTQQEVNCLEKILNLKKSDAILDLCGGQGRHAIELSRRGFTNITVLDYSHYLITLGQQQARQAGFSTQFIQGDARDVGLREASFQYIIVMASSFGYFIDEGENLKILQEAYRLLQPKGTLLLDLINRDYMLKRFKPFSVHQVNEDITVQRERVLGDDIIFSKETVISATKGHIRTKTYCTRLYSPQKISTLLFSAGFSSVECISDFMDRDANGDFGCLTNRMIILAKKP
ncbi:MAG: class I SAM-dependent methyltransferase [candidate division KSB1 bacterium]|nr:class I SAM-dependent methyltransferase [candidate division KSB1 bacterium]MDZ7334848.1 class I SAM-dependent methyltransferase [candidate division KSB1 bacterium]MDZ7357871.1 class I SAM-dependent methyltransferase [candidate division KSB1 bacterium]MDZ7376944.1 class I SAM-dependent methyltransferase [candidate division KSB1 bacterium]MDZ7400423.1 class I SAM-dependent methyltransferase [candidate division KSB1 bacterium]